MSLSRQWQQQGKCSEARELLVPIYDLTFRGVGLPGYDSPHQGFAIIWKGTDATSSIQQRLDVFDRSHLNSLNMQDIIAKIADAAGLRGRNKPLDMLLDVMTVAASQDVAQTYVQGLAHELLAVAPLKNLYEQARSQNSSNLSDPYAPINLKGISGVQEKFEKFANKLRPLAQGEQGKVVLEKLEFNPTSYTLNVRLRLHHEESFGTFREAINRVVDQSEAFVRSVGDKVKDGVGEVGKDIEEGLASLGTYLDQTYKAIAAEAAEAARQAATEGAQRLAEEAQRLAEEAQKGINAIQEAAKVAGGQAATVVQKAQGCLRGACLVDVPEGDRLTPTQLILATARYQLDKISREVLGRPMTLGEYACYTAKLADDSSLDAVRMEIAHGTPICIGDYSVSFRTHTGQYLVAEGGGGGVVNANRAAPGPWETFRLTDLNGGTLQSGDDIHLATHNGMFVVAEGGGGGVVNANRPRASHWERFTLRKVRGSSGHIIRSGDTIALLARNGQYVVAEGGGGGVVNANRPARGPWEEFTIHMPDAAPLEALYQAVLGRAMDDSGWQTYANALANGGTLEQVRNAFAHSAEASGYLAGIYQAVLGRAMDDSKKQSYANALANGGTLGQVRSDIAHSAEASGHLAALHQEVWGRPIDAAYLDYYTFLLSTDGTLADVRADMEALHLQMVVLPVLIAVSLVQ
jgi:ElaB/YqjD/DUF883 family membrane-anchored ribosome-binding protein